MTFSEKMLKLRKENGLSQQDVAERLGVSRQTISRWETGTASPSADSLKWIAQLFQVPVDYLLDDALEQSETPPPDLGEPKQDEVNAKKPTYRRRRIALGIAAALLAGAICFCLWNRQPEEFNEGMKVETAEESVDGRVVNSFSFAEW